MSANRGGCVGGEGHAVRRQSMKVGVAMLEAEGWDIVDKLEVGSGRSEFGRA